MMKSKSLSSAILALFLLVACAHRDKASTQGANPPSSLQDMVLLSDLIIRADIKVSDVPAASGSAGFPGKVTARVLETWRGSQYGEVEIRWSENPTDQRIARSGGYVLFLKRAGEGVFVGTQPDRSFFPSATVRLPEYLRDYVPYVYPNILAVADTNLVDIRSIPLDSSAKGASAVRRVPGIYFDEFREYVREVQIRQVMGTKDSNGYDFLLESKNFNLKGGNTLIHLAVEYERLDLVGPLVGENIYIDHSNRKEESPLVWCIAWDDLACLDTMLTHGANINLKTPDDRAVTPVHQAINRVQPNSLRWLLRKGAGAGQADARSRRPLHQAACRNLDLLKAVAYAQDSLEMKTRSGRMPIDYAMECKKPENAAYLKELITARAARGRKPVTDPEYPQDPPYKGDRLLSYTKDALAEAAAASMYRLAGLACGLQALELGAPESQADSICGLFLEKTDVRASLGPVILKEFEGRVEPAARDSILVRYIQMSHGNPFPIWLSDQLVVAGAILHDMQRQFENLVMSSVIETLVTTRKSGPGNHEKEDRPGPKLQ